jgi:hypothetical protein
LNQLPDPAMTLILAVRRACFCPRLPRPPVFSPGYRLAAVMAADGQSGGDLFLAAPRQRFAGFWKLLG